MNKFKNKPTSVLSASDMKTPKGKLAYGIMCFIMLIQCAIALVPSIWIIFTAFKETQEIYNSNAFFPADMSFTALIGRITSAWAKLQFGRDIWNTVVMSLGNLVMGLVICGMGGYVISRLKPKGSRVIFAIILWTMMMPGQMRTVPLYISWIKFPFIMDFEWEVSLLNTYWPVWLSTAANAYFVMLFKNYFDSIPISYIEAAKIDGCGNIRTFFNIMIPLSMPIILYVSIGLLNSGWTNFFTPYLVLTDASKRTVPVTLFLQNMKGGIAMNDYMMGLLMACIVPFITFAILQKYIVGGVNIGGVKG